MISQTIVSLAILKVNWDRGKDFLENFVPFVAECARLADNDFLSVSELQADLRNRFTLDVPQNVLATILRRMARREYVNVKRGLFVRNVAKLKELDFAKVRLDVLSRHERVVESLIKYSATKFSVEWNTEEAELALESYLNVHQLVPLSVTVVKPVVLLNQSSKSTDFVVGSFIHHIGSNHSSEFAYLETLVVGNMLANAVFLPDIGSIQKKFHNTSIYFDTSFLIYGLGHGGDPRKQPCLELLTLLKETGANLCCFNHTRDEIRGALSAIAHRMRRGELADAYGPSIEYFVMKGLSASDVELRIGSLERDLQALGIRVVQKPPYVDTQYVIDEKGLEALLSQRIPYHNPEARRRDVESISAVSRLRREVRTPYIEECRALFVTTNWTLATVSRSIDGVEAGYVPYCMTDYQLTNQLWLKKPLAAPDLPRKRIIADCYAATQPNEDLLRAYSNEVDKLASQDQVTREDYYYLKYHVDARADLAELTLGEESAFTPATVKEILELHRSRTEADVRTKYESRLQEEMQRRSAAESEIDAREKREVARQCKISSFGATSARWLTRIVECVLLVVLLVGGVSAFPWEFPDFDLGTAGRYSLSLLQLAVSVAAVLNLWRGTTVKDMVNRAEIRLAKWIEKIVGGIVES